MTDLALVDLTWATSRASRPLVVLPLDVLALATSSVVLELAASLAILRLAASSANPAFDVKAFMVLALAASLVTVSHLEQRLVPGPVRMNVVNVCRVHVYILSYSYLFSYGSR